MQIEGRRIPLLVFMAAVFAGCTESVVRAQSYTTFDVPGATETHPLGINNRGDVTGYFRDPQSGQMRGFVREFNGRISTFDGVPTSINDAGTVAGTVGSLWDFHSFIRDRTGSVTIFDVPGVSPPAPAGPWGYPTAINNRGEVAGYIVACGMCDALIGFVRDKHGEITTFYLDRGLQPNSINARGDIAGNTSPYFVTRPDGFVRDKNGAITLFDMEGWALNCPSINNRGDIAGFFFSPQLNRSRSFVREANGNIAIFDATPGALQTYSASINERGDTAGHFTDASGDHGFLRDQSGKITVFGTPGSITGLNDPGDVTGYYSDFRNGQYVTHGFIGTTQ